MSVAGAIQVRCACGRTLTAPAGSEGRRARCPACGASMVIESDTTAQRQAASAKGPAATSRSSANSNSTGSSSAGPNRAAAVAATARANAAVAGPPAPAPAPPAQEDNDRVQSLYEVADEMEAAPVEEVPRCPHCRSPMAGGAVFCVTCGYDSRTDQRASTATLEQPKSGRLSRRGTMNEQKPSLSERLMAQWPGLAGFLIIGVDIFWVWYVHTFGGYISFGGVGLIFGVGIAALGYWSMANRNGNCNF